MAKSFLQMVKENVKNASIPALVREKRAANESERNADLLSQKLAKAKSPTWEMRKVAGQWQPYTYWKDLSKSYSKIPWAYGKNK